jgi:D-alanine-D-alanine ligase
MKVVVLHQGDWRLASANPLVKNAVDAERELAAAVRRCGADCVSVLLDAGMHFVHSLQSESPDLVFNICDLGLGYDPKFEPHVTAILDTLHLPYTGSNFLSLALTNDKLLCKKLLMSAGVTCPAAVAIRPGQPTPPVDIALPVICKPLADHNSKGIDFTSVVYSSSELERQVSRIEAGSVDYLIEQYIDGREITAGFLGNGDEMLVLPLEEIVFGEYFRDKPRILTYDAKWADADPANLESKAVIPAVVSSEQRARIRAALVKIAAVFGIKDYGRVDFRLDNEGNAFAIDVNANPDLSFGAGLSKMATSHGLEYFEMIKAVVESALRRTRN